MDDDDTTVVVLFAKVVPGTTAEASTTTPRANRSCDDANDPNDDSGLPFLVVAHSF